MKNGYFNQEQDVGFYISYSKISLMLESPADYFARYGEGYKKAPTAAMERGVMLHEAVLRPESFERRSFVHEFKDFRSNAAKEWRDQIKKKNPDCFILSKEERDAVRKITDAVWSDPMAAYLLKDGMNERFGYAEHNGMTFLSRPDLVTKGGIIADLKFVRSIDAAKFNRQQAFEDWYVQLGYYNKVHGLIIGNHSNQNACYIAVQAEYPHRVQVFTLSKKYEDAAEIKINKAIELIKYFMEKDPEFKIRKLWFEYDAGVKELEPSYGFLAGDSDFNGLIEL